MTMSATHAGPRAVPLRPAVVGVIAFLTLVDLFAAQAILPTLTRTYGVSPAAMALAVNACTLGMATAGILIAIAGRHIDRRIGVTASLALLSLPTALLAFAPDLMVFTALRVAQGVFMATAFTLTMAHLSENGRPQDTAAALAAYITGNVASNLIGRLISAAVADHLGLAPNFLLFAALNLAGAGVTAMGLTRCGRMETRTVPAASPAGAILLNLRTPALAASFAIGFLILFVFIGTFSFVNFVLVRPPVDLAPMALGLVYLVFVPSMLTTPFAGRAALRLGARRTVWLGLGAAAWGLPLLLTQALPAILLGLALVGAGTFFAQAAATGFVGRAAAVERGTASGLYLASYYLGGLAGTAVLGPVFDGLGWPATVAGLGAALGLACWFARALRSRRT